MGLEIWQLMACGWGGREKVNMGLGLVGELRREERAGAVAP